MGWWNEAKRWWRNQRALSRLSHVNLWVDSKQPAPEGWYWAKTVREAVDVLETCVVHKCSFNHDFGESRNGADLIYWLAERKHFSGLNLWPQVRPAVHSTHPAGRQLMNDLIDQYGPYDSEGFSF